MRVSLGFSMNGSFARPKVSQRRKLVRSPFLCQLLMLLALCVLTGCQHLKIRDRWFDTERVSKLPSEVLPIWTDTVLHQPGKPGVRGFGGRVYFYEPGKPDPVKVDGQLVVYAFDGNPNTMDNVAPLKKFVFTPDQLLAHHSQTSLGNSYSIWLPWDKVGGESRTLSLVARFDGRKGGTAMSKPSRMLLPGLKGEILAKNNSKNGSSQENTSKSGIQLAGYEVVSEVGVPESQSTDGQNSESQIAGSQNSDRGGSQDRLSLESTSIDLPPSFQRRLMASQNVVASPSEQASTSSGNWEPLSPRQQAVAQAWGEEDRLPGASDQRSAWAEYSYPVTETAAHYAPQRFPARRTPKVQPGPAVLRRQPHPGGWPGGLPPTPRNDSRWRSSPDSPALPADRLESARPELFQRNQSQVPAWDNTQRS